MQELEKLLIRIKEGDCAPDYFDLLCDVVFAFWEKKKKNIFNVIKDITIRNLKWLKEETKKRYQKLYTDPKMREFLKIFSILNIRSNFDQMIKVAEKTNELESLCAIIVESGLYAEEKFRNELYQELLKVLQGESK